MAVSNSIGSIIAKYVIGDKPAIFYCEEDRRYHIITYADEIAYKKIMDESAICGLKIFRDTIDKIIIDLHNYDDFILQHSMRIYNDTGILPGERVRLFFKDAELDLIKIRPRYYICIDGALKGEFLAMDSDSLDFNYKGKYYIVESMAFLAPCDAYTIIDYKYLKNYRSEVADDISDLYNEVNVAVLSGTIVAEFDNLLTMCAGAGVSLWTLMGMIEHAKITIERR